MRSTLLILPAVLLAAAVAEEPMATADRPADLAADLPADEASEARGRTAPGAAPFADSEARRIGVDDEDARLVLEEEESAQVDAAEAFPQLDDALPDAGGRAGLGVGLGLTGLRGAELPPGSERGPEPD